MTLLVVPLFVAFAIRLRTAALEMLAIAAMLVSEPKALLQLVGQTFVTSVENILLNPLKPSESSAFVVIAVSMFEQPMQLVD